MFVCVFDSVFDDVREARMVREFVGVPVEFGVTEGVTDAAGQFNIALPGETSCVKQDPEIKVLFANNSLH